MSINSNMKSIILQENTPTRSTTGANKDNWKDKDTILIAIYEIDSRVNTNSAIYNESTHIGLTFNKNIKAIRNRLKDEDNIYSITGVKLQGRLTQVFLKVIENV